ncbi:hypothetical protein O9565_19025, partial [Proteus mirabilis]|nr:hypothetical protein [Proteus mirabilis]
AVIIALYCADRINLWQAQSLPLPIEKNDFRFEIPAIHASIIGVKATQEVSVIFREDYTHQQSPLTRRLEKQTRVQKITETVI